MNTLQSTVESPELFWETFRQGIQKLLNILVVTHQKQNKRLGITNCLGLWVKEVNSHLMCLHIQKIGLIYTLKPFLWSGALVMWEIFTIIMTRVVHQSQTILKEKNKCSPLQGQ